MYTKSKCLVLVFILYQIEASIWRGPRIEDNEEYRRRIPYRRTLGSRDCKLPHLRNGEATKTRWRQRVMFTCDNGYHLVGNEYATCRNSEWDVRIPSCVRDNEYRRYLSRNRKDSLDDCELPYLKHGMTMRSPSKWTEKVMFTCDNGYHLVGNESATCEYSEWDVPIPFCADNLANSTDDNPGTGEQPQSQKLVASTAPAANATKSPTTIPEPSKLISTTIKIPTKATITKITAKSLATKDTIETSTKKVPNVVFETTTQVYNDTGILYEENSTSKSGTTMKMATTEVESLQRTTVVSNPESTKQSVQDIQVSPASKATTTGMTTQYLATEATKTETSTLKIPTVVFETTTQVYNDTGILHKGNSSKNNLKPATKSKTTMYMANNKVESLPGKTVATNPESTKEQSVQEIQVSSSTRSTSKATTRSMTAKSLETEATKTETSTLKIPTVVFETTTQVYNDAGILHDEDSTPKSGTKMKMAITKFESLQRTTVFPNLEATKKHSVQEKKVIEEPKRSSGLKTGIIIISAALLCITALGALLIVITKTVRGRVALARLRGHTTRYTEVRYLNADADYEN